MLEGHKILYRVSLAVLKLNEHAILNIGEQVSVLVFLKEIVHHMFNIEEILNVSTAWTILFTASGCKYCGQKYSV